MTRIVVGIDVGGPKKGFHGVALRDGSSLSKCDALDARLLVRWCLELEASAIGIDAPCRWSTSGRARPAERELATKHIRCFATPTRHTAECQNF